MNSKDKQDLRRMFLMSLFLVVIATTQWVCLVVKSMAQGTGNISAKHCTEKDTGFVDSKAKVGDTIGVCVEQEADNLIRIRIRRSIYQDGAFTVIKTIPLNECWIEDGMAYGYFTFILPSTVYLFHTGYYNDAGVGVESAASNGMVVRATP